MRLNNRCYNSGRITGEKNFVKNFIRADLCIIDLGHSPVNPLYNGLSDTAPWMLHMFVDILILLTCRHIYFQKNWRQSRGARVEYKIAKLLRMGIYYQEFETSKEYLKLNKF